MGILINLDFAATTDPLDGILIDIARRIQVPKTKHEKAADHFLGLCAHVDRKGSPLEGKVRECYPSGSFSSAAVIYSHVRSMKGGRRMASAADAISSWTRLSLRRLSLLRTKQAL